MIVACQMCIGVHRERTVNFQAPETFRVSAEDHPMQRIDRMAVEY